MSNFRHRYNLDVKKNYTSKEALEYLGGPLVKCALTGVDINMETDEYCLDHIIPVSKGGTNELDNMQVVCSKANAAKSDMTMDEFLDLCESVLIYHNRKIDPERYAQNVS